MKPLSPDSRADWRGPYGGRLVSHRGHHAVQPGNAGASRDRPGHHGRHSRDHADPWHPGSSLAQQHEAQEGPDPILAARTLVLAQACAYAGTVLLGWHAGIFVDQLRIWTSRSDQGITWVAIAVAGGGSVMIVVGLLVERFCRIPPRTRTRQATENRAAGSAGSCGGRGICVPRRLIRPGINWQRVSPKYVTVRLWNGPSATWSARIVQPAPGLRAIGLVAVAAAVAGNPGARGGVGVGLWRLVLIPARCGPSAMPNGMTTS